MNPFLSCLLFLNLLPFLIKRGVEISYEGKQYIYIKLRLHLFKYIYNIVIIFVKKYILLKSIF